LKGRKIKKTENEIERGKIRNIRGNCYCKCKRDKNKGKKSG
jgi:hypothetical protein